jgi:sirohydrochlorin ferrochelatase
MKKVLLSALMVLTSVCVNAQKALVVIAHGAPSNAWNAPVLALENQVKDELKARGINDFDYVRVALMEFSEPSMSTVFADCEKQGVKQVFALPLFITSSSHSEQDVPNILGLKFNPNTVKDLKEEGAKFVDTDMKVTVGPTLSYGDVIPEIIAERVKEMSKDAKNETFVILAHGDADYVPMWNDLLKRAAEKTEETTGIKFGGSQLIGMGNFIYTDAEATLIKAGKDKKRVLAQGIYLQSGLKGMADFAAKADDQKEVIKKLPKGTEYVFGAKGMLPDSRISKWIVDRAAEWIKK